MTRLHMGWLLLFLILVGCGPETIFVRPFLDTPEQHVRNGEILLRQYKWEDAVREFQRAVELDPDYTVAYVGLGVAYAQHDEWERGLQMLSKADTLAQNQEERAAVENGWAKFRQLRQDRNLPPLERSTP
ncbi:tetratricopeptide repeat protein [Desulfatitalea alkaliphila]|uniref:Tetratricopeptide repeat protein n=1 Tax=Desulfatitalea alkaliphila TaxID=2929485 RepID=A0AA41UIP8_9BACT|nr:tetratricopeptide repeat protein [Desulfatitalea alkaliphila]MCJ8500324.1 tetratricopeptide repeat protein [Desulfatitalea alkaliphila]